MENYWEVWHEHQAWLYKSIYASVRNNMDAEDILHNTMLKGLTGYKQLKDPRKAKPWLKTIAAHATIDYFREKKREQLWAIEDFDVILNRYEDISDNKILVDQFLKALPADWRAIVVMNLYYDISAKKISETTGGSYQAIRKRLFRTYNLLAKSLSPED